MSEKYGEAFSGTDLEHPLMCVKEFHEDASVCWSPRPINDIHAYLTKSPNMDIGDVLSDIKRQATKNAGLIGRDAILAGIHSKIFKHPISTDSF